MRKEQAARRDSGDVRQLGIGLSTLHRDVRPRAVEHPRRAPLRAGGWDAARSSAGRSARSSSEDRDLAARTGSRDLVVADRRRRTRRRPRTRSRSCTATRLITPLGMDTYGSRSVSVGGEAIRHAVEKVKEKARTIAAHELEVSEDDLDWADGSFRVKGAPDKARTIPDLAHVGVARPRAARRRRAQPGRDGGLRPTNFTWPCGDARLRRRGRYRDGPDGHPSKYVAVDDCGIVINPMIVDGQVHGRRRAGRRRGALRGSDLRRVREPHDLVDDAVPDPDRDGDPGHDPAIAGDAVDDEPLGVKGIGEAGTIASPPAVINAVVDALSHLGVTEVGKPASPERVWRAIREAKRRFGMIPAPFDYARAGSVEEAISLLGSDADAKVLAGGHSLLPAMRLRVARPSMLVDIGTDRRPVVRPRGRRSDRDRRAHPSPRRREQRGARAALSDRRATRRGRSATRRCVTWARSAGRSRTAIRRPTCRRAARARRGVRRAGTERHADGRGDRRSSRRCSRRRSRPTRCSPRSAIPKATAGWSYLKFQRRAQDWAVVGVSAVRVERRGPRRPDEHGAHADARGGRRGGGGGRLGPRVRRRTRRRGDRAPRTMRSGQRRVPPPAGEGPRSARARGGLGLALLARGPRIRYSRGRRIVFSVVVERRGSRSRPSRPRQPESSGDYVRRYRRRAKADRRRRRGSPPPPPDHGRRSRRRDRRRPRLVDVRADGPRARSTSASAPWS